MEYAVFESRVMELLFKTSSKLTPQLVAFRIGCPVEIARRHLEQMVTSEILVMEVDPNGVIEYDMLGRPPPTNEPMSWTTAHAAPQLATRGLPPVQQHGVSPVNIQIHNAPALPPAPHVIVVSGSEKSAGTAAVLGLFFGPLGMLYSTGIGALVMFLANLVLIPATAGLGWVITAPISAIWAASAASEHNRKLRQPFQAMLPAPAYPPPPR